MNISPINNITKRALPLLASAAIGLGALTSCSSGNKTNEYPTYKEDIVMLDNTLDSLKQVKKEGKITFPEYYSKSKDAIKKAEFNSANKDVPGKTTERVGLGAILLGTLGFVLGSAKFQLLGSSDRSFKFAMRSAAMAGAGVLSFIAGVMQEVSYRSDHQCIIENHKTKQMNRLNDEKLKYFEEQGFKISKEELDM